jgi:hypothetical protein
MLFARGVAERASRPSMENDSKRVQVRVEGWKHMHLCVYDVFFKSVRARVILRKKIVCLQGQGPDPAVSREIT